MINPINEKLGHSDQLDNAPSSSNTATCRKTALRNDDPAIALSCGSPAIHLLDCEFIQRLTNGTLDFQPHRALKKVPFVDDSGREQNPTQPNAIKLEFFLFDAWPLAKNPLIFAADRVEQFAPIKNASGVDSPESCRAALLERCAAWFDRAGKTFPRKSDGTPDAIVEISPRRCADAEDFMEQHRSLPTVSTGEFLLLD